MGERLNRWLSISARKKCARCSRRRRELVLSSTRWGIDAAGEENQNEKSRKTSVESGAEVSPRCDHPGDVGRLDRNTHHRLWRRTDRLIRAIDVGDASRNGVFPRRGHGPAVNRWNRKGWTYDRTHPRPAAVANG